MTGQNVVVTPVIKLYDRCHRVKLIVSDLARVASLSSQSLGHAAALHEQSTRAPVAVATAVRFVRSPYARGH